MIFVFGSNLEGIHGAGAAKHAAEVYGAIRGQGEGLQGNSYAIPTKTSAWGKPISLTDMQQYVDRFIAFAREHQELQFTVTPVGTGFAGHTCQGVAALFREARDLRNVFLPPVFIRWLEILDEPDS